MPRTLASLGKTLIALSVATLFLAASPQAAFAAPTADPVPGRNWECTYQPVTEGYIYDCTSPDGTERWQQDCIRLGGGTGTNFGENCEVKEWENGKLSTTTASTVDAYGNPYEPPKNPLDAFGNLLMGAVAGIALFFYSVAAVMLSVAGVLFEFAIKNLVFEFANHFGNSAGLLIGWSILRDIGNILLVFGFVWIGIQTILNTNHHSTGKTLASLVMFAALLNFSLFATEVAIDGSNAVAAGIHSQSYGVECDSNEDVNCLYKKGVATTIFKESGMGSFMDAEASANLLDGDNAQRALAFIMLAIFMLITAFTLFAGVFLLLSRAVVLAFLMITSPIGFAGMVIPFLNGAAEKWWKALVGNVLFAPAYLILIFVSLKIMQTIPSMTGGGTNLVQAMTLSDPATIGTTLIPFFLVIGFMILSTMTAKEFSVMGADFATKTAGTLTYGALGFAGRRTIGRGALGLAERMKESKFARTGMGRLVYGGLTNVAKGNFDARSSKTLGKILSGEAIDKKNKMDIGKGQHGGYDHIVHEGEKKIMEHAENIENTAQEKALLDRADRDHKTAQEVGRQLAEKQNKNNSKKSGLEKGWDSDKEKIKNQRASAGEKLSTLNTQIAGLEQSIREARKGPGVAAVEQKELDVLRADHKNVSAEIADLASIEKVLDAEREEFEKESQAIAESIALNEERVKKLRDVSNKVKRELNTRQLYADAIEDEYYSNRLLLNRTAARDINKHAIHKLIKEAGKSKTEKTLDGIKKALEKSGQKPEKAAESAQAVNDAAQEGGDSKKSDAHTH